AFGATPGGDLKAGCEFITSIVLPDSLQYVGKYQFRDCFELTSITFGKNTKQIGAGCFARAPELDIYYRGSSFAWNRIEIISDGPSEYDVNNLSNCTFHFAEADPAFTNSDNAVLTAKGDLIGTDGTTAQTLLQQAGEGAKLYKADGTEKKADAKIGTGDKLVLSDGTEIVVSVLGDINGDGEVATADARLVLRKAVNLETFDNAQNVAANVDNNKEVGVADARMILRASVNLDKAENWFADIAK
ncbi:MAG: leucine-rich repeat protein, partial [Clostridia bacterium]|nr:leucine-rich repeat protein [Clostridia bacterium]